MKTYSIRIFPDQNQVDELLKLSSIRNDIWNTFQDLNQALLETEGKIYSNYDLHKLITQLKVEKYWSKFNSKAAQRVATELFKSYQSYFQLRKTDKTTNSPNPISSTNFHTLVYNQSGWSFKDSQLIINKISFEYKTKIKNVDKLLIKELRIKFRNNKWLVDLVVEEEKKFKSELIVKNKVLALDLGLKRLATGIDNQGNVVKLSNKAKKIAKYFSKRINEVKSKQSKTVKGSKRFFQLQLVKSRLYQKKNSQVKQALHIQSKKLVNMNYKVIVVGDLEVKKLMESDKNKKCKISKSFGQSNINMFLQFLSYKSSAKNQSVEKIDEYLTTQLNCLTGKRFDSKVELSQREVTLGEGIVIDRDINSAINILVRWEGKQLALVTEPLSLESVLKKVNLFQEAPCL